MAKHSSLSDLGINNFQQLAVVDHTDGNSVSLGLPETNVSADLGAMAPKPDGFDLG